MDSGRRSSSLARRRSSRASTSAASGLLGVAIAQSVLGAAIGAPEASVDVAGEAPRTADMPSLADAMRLARSATLASGRRSRRSRRNEERTRAIGASCAPTCHSQAPVGPRRRRSSGTTALRSDRRRLAPHVPNWDVGLVVAWPIFDGTVVARREASRAAKQVAREDLERGARAASRGDRARLHRLRRGPEALPGLEQAVTAARANYEQADARFRAGLGTAVEARRRRRPSHVDGDQPRARSVRRCARPCCLRSRHRGGTVTTTGEEQGTEVNETAQAPAGPTLVERLQGSSRSPRHRRGRDDPARARRRNGLARGGTGQQGRPRRKRKARHGRRGEGRDVPSGPCLRRNAPALGRGARRAPVRVGVRRHGPRPSRGRREASRGPRHAGLPQRERHQSGRGDAGEGHRRAAEGDRGRGRAAPEPARRRLRLAQRGRAEDSAERRTGSGAALSEGQDDERGARGQRLRPARAVRRRDRDPDRGPRAHSSRPGTQIVSVVDRSTVRVVGDAPEIDFEAVAQEAIARIHVLATGRHRGRRRAPRPGSRPGNAHGPLRGRHPRPWAQLPVGTTGEISVDVGEPVAATELPLSRGLDLEETRPSSSSSTATWPAPAPSWSGRDRRQRLPRARSEGGLPRRHRRQGAA